MRRAFATARASLLELGSGITAIDTEYARPLQDASHLVVEGSRAAFIDTGANNAVPLLLDALRAKGLEPAAVDYVFLTHVHLDHAGGAGSLLRHLPNARCVVHPRGAPHMVDPAKLWAGTEAVYGKRRAREIYGTLVPIPEERIHVVADGERFDLAGRELRALYAEGHARHHYVLDDPASRGVFTGDSFGISYRELDTPAGPMVFPSATPIDFDPAGAHAAYDRVLACEPEHVYLTHYSKVGNPERLAADLHAGIDAYQVMALDAATRRDRLESLRSAMFAYLAERALGNGFEGDEDALWSILGIDVDLNAQGLEVWLERRKKVQSA
jgi:glyoxylase-like metal-dependent hydrolase (beta-lactamase superfamily II)